MDTATLEKVQRYTAMLSTADICKCLDTLGCDQAMVRGWLMDELEARHPKEFEAWLDCDDIQAFSKISQFFP